MHEPVLRRKKAPPRRGSARGAGGSKLRPVPGLFAVRCRPEAEATVAAALSQLGSVRRLKAHDLLLVELPERERQVAALAKLRAWHRDGRVEFFTPVLRDDETQLQRILTDEITVRFKHDVPAKRRATIQRKLGINTLRRNEFVPDQSVVKVPQPTGQKTLRVATLLAKSADIEYATPNFISEFRR